MIETTTIRCTPACAPSCCRLCVAAVKNSVAACCSGEAPLVASTTDSTPRNASASSSPVTTSTPAEREIATTSYPCSSSTSTRWRPTLPVAPATAILPCVSIAAPFLSGAARSFGCLDSLDFEYSRRSLHRSDSAREEQRSASWPRPDANRSLSAALPLDECGGLRARRFGERGRELRARADPELAVDAGQVHLDRPLRDEERLRDLPVRRPLGCHLRDAPLARGERRDAAEGDAARPGAGREQFLLGSGGQGSRTADSRQLDRLP